MVTDVFRDLSWTSSVPVRLIVAGHVIDSPLPDSAEYLGYVPYEQLWDQVRARSANFLLLLSRDDAWGFVVAEAMAAGLVPIVSRCVGCAQDLIIPLRPDLIVASASDAARVILDLHLNHDSRISLAARAQALAQLRTSHWAANIFCSQLATL